MNIQKFSLLESNNYSEKLLRLLARKKILPEIQDVYSNWKQDENGIDVMLGSGGICQDIAEKICSVLIENDIECTTVSQEIDEQHVYTVAKMDDGVYIIDVSPYTYETGGGYNWKKIPNVIFEESDIIIKRISPDVDDYNSYIYESIFENISNMGDDIQILKSSNMSGNTENKQNDSLSGDTGNKQYQPKEIIVDVENKDDEIIKDIINRFTLLIKKRKIRNLRVLKITGILNKLDISALKYSKLDIIMSNNDEIIATYTLNINKISNIKISINKNLVFDLDHKTYDINAMIEKMVTYYKKYLEHKNWKIK
jgi:hypothetical protein